MNLTIPKTEKELRQSYNKIRLKGLKNNLKLCDLTNQELFIWIIAKTWNFGRSLKKSIENAKCHMENRKKAEVLFGYKGIEE